jgi:ribosome-associated translation inhibitor RaiA
MSNSDFSVEFHSETDEFSQDLQEKTLERLRQIKGDHKDMVGAAVNVKEIAKGEDPQIEFKVVAYTRPDRVVASEKSFDLRSAMHGALDALERQIREKRAKLKETWKRPDLNHEPQELT